MVNYPKYYYWAHVVSVLLVGNVPGCRQIFQRWMEWQPDEQAWLTYIKFEMRYKEVDEARKIYEQFIIVHPEVRVLFFVVLDY